MLAVSRQNLVLATWTLLVFYAFVPRVGAGVVTLGADDLAALLALPFVASWILRRDFAGLPGGNGYVAVWLLILLSGILGGVIQSGVILGRVSFPTEMWQYLKRLVFFFVAVRYLSAGWISVSTGIGTFVWMMLLANGIGILQTGDHWVAEVLAATYAQDEVQLEAIVGQSIDVSRNFSITGFSTSWGGLSVFFLGITLGLVAFRSKRSCLTGAARHLVLHCANGVLCVANIFLSGSRAAILGGLCVLVAAAMLLVIARGGSGDRVRRLTAVVVATIGLGAVGIWYFAERVEFIQYRNEMLIDAYASGTNRFEDIEIAVAGLSNPLRWSFGIGNRAQRDLYVPHGVEVEPVFLLVNYGLLGLMLRYLLVFLVARQAWRRFRGNNSGSAGFEALGAAALLSIVGYMVFSLGYFFFQEAVVGALPWLFFGLLVGATHAAPRTAAPARGILNVRH